MILIPAIDLKAGKCVRLRQGVMSDETVFSDDPVAMARQWYEKGAKRLHVVDLDGATQGKPVNDTIIRQISRELPDLPLQLGGGIRNLETVAAYVEAGVDWVIIGSQAVREPDFVTAACEAFPQKVIVGLDVKDGKVAIEGWAQVSGHGAIELAKGFENAGVQAIVYTDISKDGMMQGVNVEATAALAAAVNIPVIASGGVTTMADIEKLYPYRDKGIMGAIIGRALYEGTIDLAEAQGWLLSQ